MKEDRGEGEEVNACGNVLDETGCSKPGGSPPPALTHVLLQHATATCSTYTSQRGRTDRGWVFFRFCFFRVKVECLSFTARQ